MEEDYVLSLVQKLLKIEGFDELEKEEQWSLAISLGKEIRQKETLLEKSVSEG